MLLDSPPDVLCIETKTTSVIKISEDKTNTENFHIVATHCPKNRLEIKVQDCNWVIREIIQKEQEKEEEEEEEEEEELECIVRKFQYWMKKPKYCFDTISVTGGGHTDVIFNFCVKPELKQLKCDGCKVTFQEFPVTLFIYLIISNDSFVDMNNIYCVKMHLEMRKGVIKNVNILNCIEFIRYFDGVLSNFFVHPTADVIETVYTGKQQWFLGMA